MKRENYELISEARSMLLNYSVKGYKVFYDEVSFSMLANNYIKKSVDNLIQNLGKDKSINVVKSSFIYGPNNTGKSCFIYSLKDFTEFIKTEKYDKIINNKNLFYKDDQPIEFKVEYLINDTKYYYEVHINKSGIIAEILEQDDKIILDRNNPSAEIKKVFDIIGNNKNKLYVFLLPKEYSYIGEDLKNFANSIEIYKPYEILDVNEVIKESNFTHISEMISKCDLQIDEVIDNSKAIDEYIKKNVDEKNSNNEQMAVLDELKLLSKFTFKGIEKMVPLAYINSLGTNKVVRLVYMFLNAIRENKILIIDEFENSLHTIMSKALISFFNSNNNTNAQLIATTHDLLLLDSEYLLRKDQIWFVYKDKNNNYLYSLNDFKDNKEIDSRGNTMVKYLRGLFGALPKPSLFNGDDE